MKKLVLICFTLLVIHLVGCDTEVIEAELGPEAVTDAFLTHLFTVDDYKILDESNIEDPILISMMRLAPLEPYATMKVIKSIHFNRQLYFIAEEAKHYNGNGKWVKLKSEIRDQTDSQCTVWYSGEFVIVSKGGKETRLLISGTTLLKHDETGWMIHGNTFIVFPIGETLYGLSH